MQVSPRCHRPAALAAAGQGGEQFAACGCVDAVIELAANDTPVRLRVERKFNVLGKKKAPLLPGIGVDHPVELKKGDAYPLFIVADNIEGQVDDVTDASGEVVLRKSGTEMFADKVIYWPLEDEVDATGQVRLLQEGWKSRRRICG